MAEDGARVVLVDRVDTSCAYEIYANSFCGRCGEPVQLDERTALAVMSGSVFPLCLVCAHQDELVVALTVREDPVQLLREWFAQWLENDQFPSKLPDRLHVRTAVFLELCDSVPVARQEPSGLSVTAPSGSAESDQGTH